MKTSAYEKLSTSTFIKYAPRGTCKEIFTCRAPEVLLSGPAGTGKSRAVLEKCHLMLTKYPKSRGLMVRKTRMSMTETCMWTYENKVLHDLDHVQWKAQEQRYEYPNGSQFIVCGMDKPSKVLSSEFDFCYANESTELGLGDWETIMTRLRNGVIPYQQIIADCNPDAPTHWLKQRVNAGKVKCFESRHEDNPLLWDAKNQEWTEKGKSYLEKLEALTGVRYLRLRHGVWAAAEGMIYDEWDPTVHLIPYRPIPTEWNRYWTIDFGYTDPFVWQYWAEDEDGRLYLLREIYHTKRTVREHCELIKELMRDEPRPRAIICDHDAEDRATVEKEVGMLTVAAYKAIRPGIDAVKNRLKKQGDGRSRIFVMRDALVEVDKELAERYHPTCTAEEVENYVWDQKALQRGVGDVPIDKFNHGMDAARYMVAFADSLAEDPQEYESLAFFEDRVRISPY